MDTPFPTESELNAAHAAQDSTHEAAADRADAAYAAALARVQARWAANPCDCALESLEDRPMRGPLLIEVAVLAAYASEYDGSPRWYRGIGEHAREIVRLMKDAQALQELHDEGT